jgi:hypothetical protein
MVLLLVCCVWGVLLFAPAAAVKAKTVLPAAAQHRQDTCDAAHRPIVFWHIHKNMGSSMCALAHKTECLTQEQHSQNCNLLQDSPKTRRDSIGRSCDERQTLLDKFRTTAREFSPSFMAIERFMDPEICPDRFLYITVLRDPLERIASHAAMHKQTSIMHRVDKFPPVPGTGNSRWNYWSRSTFNNFYIRLLNGRERYISAAPVTNQDLLEAQERLALFEYVIIQERFAEAGPILAALGWRPDAHTAKPKNTRKHSKFADSFTAEERKLLRDWNLLDQQFVRYGEQLFDQALARLAAAAGAGAAVV